MDQFYLIEKGNDINKQTSLILCRLQFSILIKNIKLGFVSGNIMSTGQRMVVIISKEQDFK